MPKHRKTKKRPETNLLRSAWNFPIGFPDNVIANRVPGSPNVTPPMSPRTPPGPPPETPVVFSPMTPPELLLHLVSPGTPEEVWRSVSAGLGKKWALFIADVCFAMLWNCFAVHHSSQTLQVLSKTMALTYFNHVSSA